MEKLEELMKRYDDSVVYQKGCLDEIRSLTDAELELLGEKVKNTNYELSDKKKLLFYDLYHKVKEQRSISFLNDEMNYDLYYKKVFKNDDEEIISFSKLY